MTFVRTPRGSDAARLLYADDARRLSDFVRKLVPTSRDHGAGDFLHEALLVAREAERLVEMAVIVERALGTTWEAIGDTAGGITKQSAQKKWAGAPASVELLADGIHPDVLRSRHVSTGQRLAEDLDAWCARQGEDDDVERPVSGYLLDPGPAPDLSQYSGRADDAYEWLLSDHPWARAERARRAGRDRDAELRNAGEVRAWTDRIGSTDLDERYRHAPEIAANLRGLAELMRPLADEGRLRAYLDAAASDEVRVDRLREQWATHKRAEGDRDYVYPPRLRGAGAAAHPPPASGFESDPVTPPPA